MTKINGKLLLLILFLASLILPLLLRSVIQHATPTQKTTSQIIIPNTLYNSPTDEQLYHGKIQFKLRCSKCHGMIGQGKTAPALNQKPYNPTAAYLIIYNGIPNKMKGWGNKIQKSDIVSMVHYIKSLSDSSNKEKPH